MRTPRRLFLSIPVALALLVGTACGGTGPDPRADADPDAPTLATLVVGTTSEPRVVFEEGAVPEIRLVSADGTVIDPVADHVVTARFRGVVPGDYTLRAAQRPCAGSCDHLDPPMNQCEGALHVAGDTRASVIFVRHEPCTVTPRVRRDGLRQRRR